MTHRMKAVQWKGTCVSATDQNGRERVIALSSCELLTPTSDSVLMPTHTHTHGPENCMHFIANTHISAHPAYFRANTHITNTLLLHTSTQHQHWQPSKTSNPMEGKECVLVWLQELSSQSLAHTKKMEEEILFLPGRNFSLRFLSRHMLMSCEPRYKVTSLR